jgi:starch synthase
VKVLFVSSEIYPLATTGGLADVSAALPNALATLGVDIRLVLPGYPTALHVAAEQRPETKLDNLPDAALTQVVSARLPNSGLPVWLVDSPALVRKEG